MIVRAAALVLGVTLALPGLAAAHGGGSGEDAARGIVLDGLVRAAPGSECAAVGWEIRAKGESLGCTHGPDPAPEGVDVRAERSLAELAEGTTGAPPVACTGDGVSGPRVQAVYAHPADRPSRFADVAPLIAGWSGDVAEVFRASAVRTGGEREVRFVTGGACTPTVLEVAVSPDAVESFGRLVADLRSRGLARSDRRYLVWMDATGYCGIAQMYGDDAPERSNVNNGGSPGLVARVDSGCWSTERRVVAAHELVHTLGGVQATAPNASPAGHCVDERDIMCYSDAPGVVMRLVCNDPLGDLRLDCNGDDYFSTSPVPGSWLAAHWNTANSDFLDGVDRDAPGAPANVRVTDVRETSATVSWEGPTDAVAFRIAASGARGVTASAPATLSRLTCGRTHAITVDALDVGGNASRPVTVVATMLPCPDVQAPAVTVRRTAARRGSLVTLRYEVVEAGESAGKVTILRGTRRLAARAVPFSAVRVRAVRWRVPARATGPLRFCVTETDRAGNASGPACAPITLLKRR